MARHLNLVENDFPNLEKRVFPRFPFGFVTFQAKGHRTFEVVDISKSGMQLELKDGEHTYGVGQSIEGSVHWLKADLRISGQVQWASGRRIGVAFKGSDKSFAEVINLLSIENLAAGLKPLHQTDLGLEVPTNLKFWLRNDGPVEVFVWQHSNREYSQFQVIIMEHFIEWMDGEGVKTGRVLTKRDLETPLFSEDEFVFQIDEKNSEERLNLALELIKKIPEGHLSSEVKEFMLFKLSN
jgi:hypothetical protein